MLSPSQIRVLRIRRLVAVATAILESGATTHLLFDKLERASFRLWPTLRDKTRREYVISSLKIVHSRLYTKPVLPETVEEAPPQELKQWTLI